MSQVFIRPFRTASMALALLFSMLPAAAWAQVNWGNTRAVGGIVVDANGVARQPTAIERQEVLAQLRAQPEQVPSELKPNTKFRKVSLRALEAALAAAVGNADKLPDGVLYLAGLQRVQYILVYPEQNDIVLAGPGEGWKFDQDGSAVGVTTGLPAVRLDDLLVALRTVDAAQSEGISVSIDPTAEGRQRFEQFMKTQRAFDKSVLPVAVRALGPQQVTLTGVPTDSHFARILFAADYRMKRLAMNLEKAPIAGLPGYLDMLKSKGQLPGTAMPRWWMACNYEPLARSGDRLAWELRGQGVKALTEDEVVAGDGTVQATGQADPIAKQWADLLTKNYTALSAKDPTLAQLRNLMDLCVVAAVIKREDLVGLAGGQGFPLLASPDSKLAVGQLPAPQTVEPQCSFLKIGRNYVITASGGVQIESWEVASKNVVTPQLKSAHSEGAPQTGKAWWWN
jgi:hypothetical protein